MTFATLKGSRSAVWVSAAEAALYLARMTNAADTRSITIVTYDDRFADAFDRLNREWLVAYGLFEESDRKHLEHPQESIIETGGEIFLAVHDETVVGTCAVVRCDDETFELVKLSVAREMRGAGLGRRLSETAISWAREHGARRVVLLSSTKLGAALKLYERMGFRYGSLPADPTYASADVFMEMDL